MLSSHFNTLKSNDMNSRRLITSTILKLHGFKYDDSQKMWIKEYQIDGTYVTMRYKYDWNARKLYCKTYQTYGGWTNTEWEYNSEADALREIRGMY